MLINLTTVNQGFFSCGLSDEVFNIEMTKHKLEV